jgi:hypothetical protein
VNVPVDASTAARAAIVLGAAGPRRLVELGLVDLPEARVAPQEGKGHRTSDLQQFGRSEFRHPRRAATSAAETGRRDAATMQGRLRLDVEPPCGEASRAIDVQLKAVAGDIADGLEWKREKPCATVTPRSAQSPDLSSDSTLWHAGAQQCKHRGGGARPHREWHHVGTTPR